MQLAIEVNGDLWREGHVSIIGSRPELPKICESLDELEEIFKTLEYRGAKRYSFRRLTAKSMSSYELLHLLEEKLVSSQTAQRLVEELKQQGYLNDAEWAESFVRQQTSLRKGPRVIAQKLKAKGFDVEQTGDLLEKLQPEESQKEAIQKLLMTRYRSRDLNDRYERDKVVAALARRGFDIGLIISTIKNEP